MTARAGDALSHVYFSWLPRSSWRPFFKAIFNGPFGANQPSRFGRLRARLEGSVGSKPNGSVRICIGAMRFRKGPNPVPRGLLRRDFVSNNEHFIR